MDAGVLEGETLPVTGSRRRRWIWLGIALAVLLLVGAGLAYRARHAAKPSDTAQVVPTITVTVPGRTLAAAQVSATGSLAARREMPVGVAGEGGMVTRVLVDAGDWVRQGQVLATIERSVQTEQAAQLSAGIVAAQANARIAQTNVDRAQALVGRGFVSKADLDQKLATRDAALAQVRIAQAQLGETRAQIGRLDIRAPAPGLVLARAVETGQVIGAGSPALFRIARDGEMEMRAQVAEQDLAGLGIGRPAQITPVGSARVFTGRIWQMPPVIDAASRQGLVRIALAYDPQLRPGGFATAAITSGAVRAPLLPNSAVQSDDKGNYVYVVGTDNRVRRQPVKVGDVSTAGITILAGLSGQERVVVSAGPFLNPGDRIKPQLAAAGSLG